MDVADLVNVDVNVPVPVDVLLYDAEAEAISESVQVTVSVEVGNTARVLDTLRVGDVDAVYVRTGVMVRLELVVLDGEADWGEQDTVGLPVRLTLDDAVLDGTVLEGEPVALAVDVRVDVMDGVTRVLCEHDSVRVSDTLIDSVWDRVAEVNEAVGDGDDGVEDSDDETLTVLLFESGVPESVLLNVDMVTVEEWLMVLVGDQVLWQLGLSVGVLLMLAGDSDRVADGDNEPVGRDGVREETVGDKLTLGDRNDLLQVTVLYVC